MNTIDKARLVQAGLNSLFTSKGSDAIIGLGDIVRELATGGGEDTFDSISSSSINPADSGFIRMARPDLIKWRDQAGTGNNTLGVDATNALVYNGAKVVISGTETTSDIAEGSNLYFTNARVIAAPVTGFTSGPGTVLAADSVLQAIQKLDGNTGTKEPAIITGTTLKYWRGDKTFQTLNTLVVPESTNLYFTNARAIAAPITGYVSGAGVVAATDSILQAIQKLNGNTAAKAASGANSDITSMTGLTGSISSPTFIHYKQTATPTTPAATFNNLYFKSDNNLYMLNSSGTETKVGVSSPIKDASNVNVMSWSDATFPFFQANRFIYDNDGNPSISAGNYFLLSFDGSNSNNVFSWTEPSYSKPYGSSFLAHDGSNNPILTWIGAQYDPPGWLTTINNTTALVATGVDGSGNFTTHLNIGDEIALSSAPTVYASVVAIADDHNLTLESPLGDGTSQSLNFRRFLINVNDVTGTQRFTIQGDGTVNMHSGKIKNLANGVAASDAVNKGQLDTKAASGANADITSMTGLTGGISSPTLINFVQIATPSNPTASHNRLYFKSDDKLYKLTPAGVESEVGGSSGVTGPGSSTDNAISTWNGITGSALRNTSATIINGRLFLNPTPSYATPDIQFGQTDIGFTGTDANTVAFVQLGLRRIEFIGTSKTISGNGSLILQASGGSTPLINFGTSTTPGNFQVQGDWLDYNGNTYEMGRYNGNTVQPWKSLFLGTSLSIGYVSGTVTSVPQKLNVRDTSTGASYASFANSVTTDALGLLIGVDVTTGNGVLKHQSAKPVVLGSNGNANITLNSGGSIALLQVATPSNPASGFDDLYFKSTNLAYTLTSGGVESSLDQWNTQIISASQGASAGATYLLHTNAGAITLTLPAPTRNAFVKLKDIDGGASTNNITIAPNGGEKIEGLAANKVFSSDFGSWILVADGTDWWIF